MPAAQTSTHPASLDEAELRAWRGFLRTYARVTKTLERELESDHGLPLSSYEVLMFLSDAPGHAMRMHDLADAVILSRSGLTRLVDRLEREGWLERKKCGDDARGAFAVLTEAGAEKVHAARTSHLNAVRDRFLSVLSDDERDLLGDVWDRILGEGQDVGGMCPLETDRVP